MKSKFTIAVGALLTVFAFQNCGKGFETPDSTVGNVSLASTGGKTCMFDGDVMANGDSVKAYLTSTDPNACVSQTRVCKNGVLSGTYLYSDCVVGQSASCLFNGMTVPNGSSVPAYAATNLAYGQTCQSQNRVCNGGTLSGSYTYASCIVAKPSLVGTWVQACRVAGSGSVQQTTVFTASTFSSTIRIYPIDTTCGSQYGIANLTGNYTLGDQVMGTNVNKLDMTSIQLVITPTSIFAPLFLNGSNVCGITNWQNNVPVNVTGRTCTVAGYTASVPNGNLYTSVRIAGGNMMFVGVPDSVNETGATDAMRALTPDTVAMVKQ